MYASIKRFELSWCVSKYLNYLVDTSTRVEVVSQWLLLAANYSHAQTNPSPPKNTNATDVSA
jgi:hypothetical protein